MNQQLRIPILLSFYVVLLFVIGCTTPLPAEIVDNSPSVAPTTTATPVPEAELATEPQPIAVTESDANQHPAEALTASFREQSQTNGDVLILYGQVLDINGNPVPNTVVEIWQTDANGVYDHPGDSGTNSRDITFQFYGTAVVDVGGWYAFRTILPGQYEPRPRHIHFKVKQGTNTLLTSQFYFSDDIAEVEGEGMFQAVGESGDLLLLQLVQGDSLLLTNGRIVVDTGIGAGTLPPTPSQGEGPYYPVVNVADFDNDLATLP